MIAILTNSPFDPERREDDRIADGKLSPIGGKDKVSCL